MKLYIIYSNTHLATGACYLVDNVGKHHILIVGFGTNLFPLLIVTQTDVVPHEGMAHTVKTKTDRKEVCHMQ